MRLYEREVNLPIVRGHRNLLEYFAKVIQPQMGLDETLTRFVVTSSKIGGYRCELGILNYQQNGQRKDHTANQRPCGEQDRRIHGHRVSLSPYRTHCEIPGP